MCAFNWNTLPIDPSCPVTSTKASCSVTPVLRHDTDGVLGEKPTPVAARQEEAGSPFGRSQAMRPLATRNVVRSSCGRAMISRPTSHWLAMALVAASTAACTSASSPVIEK